MSLRWQDLRVEITTVAHHRVMRLTHMPTGVQVQAEGHHVSKRELRRQLMPKLEAAVAARHEELQARGS